MLSGHSHLFLRDAFRADFFALETMLSDIASWSLLPERSVSAVVSCFGDEVVGGGFMDKGAKGEGSGGKEVSLIVVDWNIITSMS